MEDGTNTITGTPDTGYPESRLWDRAISFYWKDTVTEAKTYVCDQGASGTQAIVALFIEKHNFNTEDMQWQYSTTGVWGGEEVDMVTDWTQGDNLQIAKIGAAAQTKRYWRVTVTNMANPQCSEIYMSDALELDVLYQSPLEYEQDNVRWNPSIGGVERGTKRGDLRKVRHYTFSLDATALTNFHTAMDNLDEYSKPFYIKDLDGVYWMCRLLDRPEETEHTQNNTYVSFKVIEML